MSPELKLVLTASGSFFLTGLLTGIWKFRAMASRADHQAPAYVDIAHRASMLYSFACLVLAKFLEFSPFPSWVNLLAAGTPVGFFASAIATYVGLGFRNQTDNQFRQRTWANSWGMWLLVAGEVGGFVVLFSGFIWTQLA